MIQKPIPYSTATVKDLFLIYNENAVRLGKPLMKRRLNSRVEMAKALALLMTHRNVQGFNEKKPRHPIRDLATKALCEISHFEVTATGERIETEDARNFSRRALTSFGFPYSAILAKVKKAIPNSKISGPALRVHAACIRQSKPGYEGTLPDRRPHSKG